jgi:mono/diheme cytochrome c family protein
VKEGFLRILISVMATAWLAMASVLPAVAAEPVLSLAIGGQTRDYSRADLLARPDAATITVAKDVSYGTAMTYRAVPLAALLDGLAPPPDSVIEAVATDGFAAQLPIDLVGNTDAKTAVAWVAVEPADAPWPPLPGKTVSAGPFYLVWTGDQVATIRSEQWPYQMAKLSSQPSPAARWPQLAVDPALPATDPIRAGQALFVTQCMVCHTLNGAGSADVGPDLNRPMNPTDYLQPAALHALIRDPGTVRSWPDRKMQGFAPDQLSDREIDQVIAYLRHMAARPAP